MPPKSDGLVADIDTALMKQVLDVSKRDRKPDIKHRRQADDLWAHLEVAKWVAFGHPLTLTKPLPRLMGS